MNRRGWLLVVAAAAALALVSLASNVTTTSQLEGKADTLLAVRFTASRLVNAGAVWAGLAVLAGWLVRRPVPAFAAGIVALLTACAVHYGTGLLVGMFDAAVWSDNRIWLLAAAVVGGPLGLVGAVARRPGRWGLAARLIVPAGAVLEPFVIGQFTAPAILPWPTRVSGFVSGAMLLTLGLLGCLRVLVVLVVRKRQPSGAELRRSSTVS
ncbi:hypothetical protein [Actinoplanes sp. NBRC 101535]|uniref:hypothetical protein n=1 Tax=Actinoplanes sp. NBRC 101535 TaxID=3032196 RepID=UPI0024A34868|nr:hypothetical protein [Actinoplanes sp. NBRC 101535]GLY00660.1 hypothetical protein Acsp01_10390 [Actinoplanes sp. NBRC 101535]